MPYCTLGSPAPKLLIQVTPHQDDTEDETALAHPEGRRDLRLIDHRNQHIFHIEGDPGELADFLAMLVVRVAQELDGVVDMAGRVYASLVVADLLPSGGKSSAAETANPTPQLEGTR